MTPALRAAQEAFVLAKARLLAEELQAQGRVWQRYTCYYGPNQPTEAVGWELLKVVPTPENPRAGASLLFDGGFFWLVHLRHGDSTWGAAKITIVRPGNPEGLEFLLDILPAK